MPAPLLAFALAAAPEILLPPWPLSRDGELVAVAGGAPLAAAGARVEPVAPGLFRVVPGEGASALRLSAGDVTVEAAVEPPPGEIAISFAPAAPVKGKDGEIRISLEVKDAGAGAIAAPEIVASTGRVRDLAAAGPERFTAIFEPAPTRHPEVAVLLALVPRCPLCATPRAIGYAIVPLAAAIDLPGRSEPGARTTVRVGGREFGPALADRAGRFSLPVVVPPGALLAHASSVDAAGNRRETRIDLRLPDVDRLACAAWPRALPADGRSEASIWCVASSAAGEPAPGAALALSAPAGEVGRAAPFRAALQRARWRAPAGGAPAEATLAARYPDGGAASADALLVALAPGAPAAISARLAREPVPLGATVAADAQVRDTRGDVVGRPSGPSRATEGFVAPDRFVARATAGDLVQHAPLAFALEPGREVATLALRREGRGWVAGARTVDARPAAGVPLRFGSGAAATTDARGEARAPASSDRESVEAPNGARAAAWARAGTAAPPFEISRTIAVPLRPPSPVDVVARLDGKVVRWRIADAAGNALAGRAVRLRSATVQLGPAERDGDGGRAPVHGGRGPVAVVDEATGVAAVVEVP